jgi:phosphoglycolate phosphatase-like HAD superfamily hydrolase
MMSRRAVGPPRWKGKTLQAILLDLDGTLLDTVEDVTVALNRATAEQQLATLTTAHVSPTKSHVPCGRRAASELAWVASRAGPFNPDVPDRLM